MSFWVAGAALGAPPGKSGDDRVLRAPAAFAWQVHHFEDLSLILRGCNSWRSGGD